MGAGVNQMGSCTNYVWSVCLLSTDHYSHLIQGMRNSESIHFTASKASVETVEQTCTVHHAQTSGRGGECYFVVHLWEKTVSLHGLLCFRSLLLLFRYRLH